MAQSTYGRASDQISDLKDKTTDQISRVAERAEDTANRMAELGREAGERMLSGRQLQERLGPIDPRSTDGYPRWRRHRRVRAWRPLEIVTPRISGANLCSRG